MSSRGVGKDLNVGWVDKKSGKQHDNEGRRFIFRTFAQRIAATNIDVFHRLTGDRADAREVKAGRPGMPYSWNSPLGSSC